MTGTCVAALIAGSLLALPPDVSAVVEQEVITRSGEIPPGVVVVYRFPVDSTQQLRIYGDFINPGPSHAEPQEERGRMVIVDPTGRRVDFFSPPPDPSILFERYPAELGEGYPYDDPERVRLVSPGPRLTIRDPLHGFWSVELGDFEQTTSITYFFRATLLGASYELTCPQRIVTVRHGEPVRIEVRLQQDGQPSKGAAVTATLQYAPASQGERMVLRDEGGEGDRVAWDGVYTTTQTFDEPGSYFLAMKATDKSAFQRLETVKVLVLVGGATLGRVVKEEPLDADGNGKYEALQVVVEVDVSDAQVDYAVSASLLTTPSRTDAKRLGIERLDPHPFHVANTSTEVPRNTGLHPVTLSFPGKQIIRTQLDGSFETEIALVEQHAGVIESLRPPYQTKPYRWEEFEAGSTDRETHRRTPGGKDEAGHQGGGSDGSMPGRPGS